MGNKKYGSRKYNHDQINEDGIQEMTKEKMWRQWATLIEQQYKYGSQPLVHPTPIEDNIGNYYLIL